MRLIDADELKKDDEVTMWLSNDAIRTGKQLKMFSEYFINKIDNMPTVQAVPIEVLQEIRTEIDNHCSDNRDRNDGLYIAMKIIDKHIEEYTE